MSNFHVDPYGYGTYAGYPYAEGDEVVGAPPPPPPRPHPGSGDLFGKLAVVGVVVAGVAGAYLVLQKMSKSDKRARKQSAKSMMKMIGRKAERSAERAVSRAGDKLGEFFEARALPPAPRHMKFEIVNKR